MSEDDVKKFLLMIKKSENDKQLEDIINKIYEDGFEDGHDSEKGYCNGRDNFRI